MANIKILIVDDEKPARRKMLRFLKNEQGIESINEVDNGIDAVKVILKNKIDIVFLDIQMPGMTGFEVINAVGIDQMPLVVFVTAFNQYAIDAFEVQAVDYLLKPFDHERFKKAFEHAIKRLTTEEVNSNAYEQLLSNLYKNKEYLNRILVNKGQRYFFIKAEDIVYIESCEKYVKVYTEKGSFLKRDTMTNMENCLNPSKFVRIHRSHIVNFEFIKEMQPWSHGDYIAILKTGEKLTISRRFRDRLFDHFPK